MPRVSLEQLAREVLLAQEAVRAHRDKGVALGLRAEQALAALKERLAPKEVKARAAPKESAAPKARKAQ